MPTFTWRIGLYALVTCSSLIFSSGSGAVQICRARISTGSDAIQLQGRPLFTITWRPYFHLTSPPGVNQIGTLQTRCPSFLRTWDLTMSDGSHGFTIASQIPLTTTFISSYSALSVLDCNNVLIGTVTESYSDAFVNQ